MLFQELFMRICKIAKILDVTAIFQQRMKYGSFFLLKKKLCRGRNACISIDFDNRIERIEKFQKIKYDS